MWQLLLKAWTYLKTLWNKIWHKPLQSNTPAINYLDIAYNLLEGSWVEVHHTHIIEFNRERGTAAFDGIEYRYLITQKINQYNHYPYFTIMLRKDKTVASYDSYFMSFAYTDLIGYQDNPEPMKLFHGEYVRPTGEIKS